MGNDWEPPADDHDVGADEGGPAAPQAEAAPADLPRSQSSGTDLRGAPEVPTFPDSSHAETEWDPGIDLDPSDHDVSTDDIWGHPTSKLVIELGTPLHHSVRTQHGETVDDVIHRHLTNIIELVGAPARPLRVIIDVAARSFGESAVTLALHGRLSVISHRVLHELRRGETDLFSETDVNAVFVTHAAPVVWQNVRSGVASVLRILAETERAKLDRRGEHRKLLDDEIRLHRELDEAERRRQADRIAAITRRLAFLREELSTIPVYDRGRHRDLANLATWASQPKSADRVVALALYQPTGPAIVPELATLAPGEMVVVTEAHGSTALTTEQKVYRAGSDLRKKLQQAESSNIPHINPPSTAGRVWAAAT